MRDNIARLSTHIASLGCQIRPHVKTHKSVVITEQIVAMGNTKGITVSTLKEARHFFSHGYCDILYAVGIVPNKFSAVQELIQQGCDIKIILDSLEAAKLLIEYAQAHNSHFKVLIELDVDNHRAGVDPKGEELLDIAKVLSAASFINFLGVMTHAGGSYDCFTFSSQQALAKQERDLSLIAAERIRQCHIPCPVVSIGSTPTAFAIDDLAGITEVRAGVYVLFDLVMAGLGVCSIDNIAISVLGSIIGLQKQKQLALTDAGWMAMSRDRGTHDQEVDHGYGIICNTSGHVYANIFLKSANQEHGIIGARNTKENSCQAVNELNQLAIGELIRILPNHACATAAQYDHYYLVDGAQVVAKLASCNGW